MTHDEVTFSNLLNIPYKYPMPILNDAVSRLINDFDVITVSIYIKNYM